MDLLVSNKFNTVIGHRLVTGHNKVNRKEERLIMIERNKKNKSKEAFKILKLNCTQYEESWG